eukprot:TRINITY_DN719_c0_g1_i10.p1 TRINITY_DN719_c0_g1~~TRINITY_DN719_c0_g1_i10.p1  ORF type:complete len:105 (-),score=19.31 TRINITY_DN719_c0_g1_i10:287-601(-)
MPIKHVVWDPVTRVEYIAELSFDDLAPHYKMDFEDNLEIFLHSPLRGELLPGGTTARVRFQCSTKGVAISTYWDVRLSDMKLYQIGWEKGMGEHWEDHDWKRNK